MNSFFKKKSLTMDNKKKQEEECRVKREVKN